MSTWISDEKGILHPAKERVSLRNISDNPIKTEQTADDGKKFMTTVLPGAEYIYEGPDRAAMFQWWEENGKPSAEKIKEMGEGNVTFGEDFRMNTEFLEQYAKARNMFGFKDVDEYLEYLGYDQAKAHKKFEEKASKVTFHELPSRIPEIKKLGGGQNYAKGSSKDPDRYGGFGDMPNN
jgi:hypothetical protein